MRRPAGSTPVSMTTMERKRIGVLGGMGPYAGIDLVKKIFDQTVAATDQEHLDVLLVSAPSVPDRTAFLLGGSGPNPAHAIAAALLTLERAGASVAGIACNTAHAPRIFDVVVDELRTSAPTLAVLSIVEETLAVLEDRHRNVRRVGILSTTGTLRTRIYSDAVAAAGLTAITPDEATQELVHQAIYDRGYGIKARSSPVSERAREDVLAGIRDVAERGAEVIVLGCTELPLAIPESTVLGLPVLDPAVSLARALIRRTRPESLRPL